MPFVALGLMPEFASSLMVPRRIGHARAAEKIPLGDPVTPREAVDWGLANAVLPAAKVVGHARRVAERFGELPPGAVQGAKRLLRAPLRGEVLAAIRAEAALFAERLTSPEAREAFQAFLEKRPPDFSRF